jgi:hypothetical protein
MGGIRLLGCPETGEDFQKQRALGILTLGTVCNTTIPWRPFPSKSAKRRPCKFRGEQAVSDRLLRLPQMVFCQKAIHRNVHPRLFFVQNATLERELSAVVNQS